MSVFIDVSGSCKSVKNTGIQRVTRQLFAALSAETPVTPVCWNSLGNYYHRLGQRELECLVGNSAKKISPVSRPEFRGEKFPGELRRRIGRKAIDLAGELQDRHVLLVPDLFTDRRSEQLPAIIHRSHARSVAIFYDAASLRLGLFSRAAAERFRKYVKSLAAFDLVICISQESRDALLQLWQQYGVVQAPETCVEGLPLGFDQSERSLERKSSRKVILCVGSFEARKNHLKLFDAANQLWDTGLDFELQLIGRSSGPWGPKIVPRLRRMQTTGRPIRWLKHVDDLALHRAYRECDFTIYPSLAEGFGLPILESLWHGKPCICGSNGALGEVAAGGGCLLVDQTSASGLAEGMKTLLTDRVLYEKLRGEAQQRSFRSWADYAASLLKHLQIPISAASPSPALAAVELL
jgi:glycosyltransferase involved in cell wall biosynthesis